MPPSSWANCIDLKMEVQRSTSTSEIVDFVTWRNIPEDLSL